MSTLHNMLFQLLEQAEREAENAPIPDTGWIYDQFAVRLRAIIAKHPPPRKYAYWCKCGLIFYNNTDAMRHALMVQVRGGGKHHMCGVGRHPWNYK